MSVVVKDSIDLIGNTPLLHVKNIDTGLLQFIFKIRVLQLRRIYQR